MGSQDIMDDASERIELGSDVNRLKRRFALTFPLWTLLLLVVPFAIWAKIYSSEPELLYSEDFSDIFPSNQSVITFEKGPAGKGLAVKQNVDQAFQSIGISFAFGRADHLVVKDESAPICELAYADSLEEQVASRNYNKTKNITTSEIGFSAGSPLVPEFVDSIGSNESWDSEIGTSNQNYIGISGYRFRFPGIQFSSSITPFQFTQAGYTKRYRGKTCIYFHEPGQPKKLKPIRRVGFYAARIDVPECLQVRLYTPDGQLICSQSNFNTPCTFV